jgi:hypothetical protein
MNEIEAIKDIKENIKPVVGGMSLDMAMAALEKQIAKRPLDTEQAWLCPLCKSHIIHEQLLMYCRQCGQLVTWRLE